MKYRDSILEEWIENEVKKKVLEIKQLSRLGEIELYNDIGWDVKHNVDAIVDKGWLTELVDYLRIFIILRVFQ